MKNIDRIWVMSLLSAIYNLNLGAGFNQIFSLAFLALASVTWFIAIAKSED